MRNAHIQRFYTEDLRLLANLIRVATALLCRTIRHYAPWALAALLLADNAAQAWDNDVALSLPVVEAAQQRFHIPAGSMKRVLDRFEDQSGLWLTYDTAVTENANSMGVNGRYSPMLALQMLLTCTGVNYHFIGGDTVILTRFVMAPPVQLPGAMTSAQ